MPQVFFVLGGVVLLIFVAFHPNNSPTPPHYLHISSAAQIHHQVNETAALGKAVRLFNQRNPIPTFALGMYVSETRPGHVILKVDKSMWDEGTPHMHKADADMWDRDWVNACSDAGLAGCSPRLLLQFVEFP